MSAAYSPSVYLSLRSVASMRMETGFYHNHIQVITKQGLEYGYLPKGYCSREDLAVINDLCSSSAQLFKRD
jgi:hypothetical protein